MSLFGVTLYREEPLLPDPVLLSLGSAINRLMTEGGGGPCECGGWSLELSPLGSPFSFCLPSAPFCPPFQRKEINTIN
jgi:hypothetical protein